MSMEEKLLIAQYDQVHEHLRQQATKRNIALGFYATISAGLFALTQSQTMLTISMIGAIIFGAFIAILLTLYRAWHGIYVIQAIAIQKIVFDRSLELGDDLIKEINFTFNEYKSVEFWIFISQNMIIVINGFVLSIAIRSVVEDLVVHIAIIILGWGFLLLLVSLLIGSHIWTMNYFDELKRSKKLGTRILWILQGSEGDWTNSSQTF